MERIERPCYLDVQLVDGWTWTSLALGRYAHVVTFPGETTLCGADDWFGIESVDPGGPTLACLRCLAAAIARGLVVTIRRPETTDD